MYYCQGNHLAISKECLIIHRQNAIVSMVTIENIPIANARRIISGNSLGSNSSPNSDNMRNFPHFCRRIESKDIQYYESCNRYSFLGEETGHSDRSYVSVVKSRPIPSSAVTNRMIF